ncbi:hypothetical protein B0H65DRAFT_443901 [Neurospora tetraspora]|uniref:Uncharacterized protein n=1 Tax=Neurospora tetraspora TaxID=94610 RepID=A0AAE0JDG4_9PEZI|nr:hypothetical protein B0H65DRAFT_443901 [Neurospora tetraspora]
MSTQGGQEPSAGRKAPAKARVDKSARTRSDSYYRVSLASVTVERASSSACCLLTSAWSSLFLVLYSARTRSTSCSNAVFSSEMADMSFLSYVWLCRTRSNSVFAFVNCWWSVARSRWQV